MQHDTTPNTSRNPPNPASAQLARLEDLDDCKVADGDPDIRGWEVKTADGRMAGKVDSLIVDTRAMQVRFLDIELDRKSLKLNEDRHVLVPIANARLDDDHDDVLLGSMTAAQVATLQPYQHGQPIVQDAAPRQDDAKKFYGKRGGTGGVQRMTLSEEQLRVGTRTKQAGEAVVHKTVDTEHVSKNVPVMHEEVTIERHVLSGDSPNSARISEGEVRIPLHAEEAVIEKRTVPKEEVVIRKKMVAGEQTVEADLKKERVDVNRDGTGTGKGKTH